MRSRALMMFMTIDVPTWYGISAVIWFLNVRNMYPTEIYRQICDVLWVTEWLEDEFDSSIQTENQCVWWSEIRHLWSSIAKSELIHLIGSVMTFSFFFTWRKSYANRVLKLISQAATSFDAGMQTLVSRFDKWFNVLGVYVEELCNVFQYLINVYLCPHLIPIV